MEKMNNLGYGQQVFILNGHPVILQRNADNIRTGILQQTLQEGTVNQMETNDGGGNCGNEYVAYVGGEQEEENSSASTIHLTLEQAAELGLHFDTEDATALSNSDTPVVVVNNEQERFDGLQGKTTAESSSVFNTVEKMGNDKGINLDNNFEASGIEPMLENLSDVSNQHLTLVPHFLNGTIAYTVQVNSNIAELKNDPKELNKRKSNQINLSSLSSLSLPSPIIHSGQNLIAATSNMNLTTGANKLAYILPDSNQTVNVGLNKSNIVNGNFSHASLPQVISTVRRPQRIMPAPPNNGVVKSKPILKNNSALNREIADSIQGLPSISNCGAVAAVTASKAPPHTVNVVTATTTAPLKASATLLGQSPVMAVSDKENNSSRPNNKEKVPNELTNQVGLPMVKPVTSSDAELLPEEVSAALSKLPVLSNNNNKKPLGSSENPIKLIQQGQTFHSVQALTDDQLKQITAVLQQQKNLASAVPTKNVLYDAETNTRIIYRVVYPEEFDLKEASASGDEVGKNKKRGRPAKNNSTDSGGPNQEEVSSIIRRKQPLPRTRSGRLSRPPRHMVRDYKRIKRLDLDDSDGGYSDYQSDHEEDTEEKHLLPGLSLPQKRSINSTFRCPTCNKIYLGYRRMAHHFDKYAGHGTLEYLNQLKKVNKSNSKQLYNPTVDAQVSGGGDESILESHSDTMNNQGVSGVGGSKGKGGLGRRRGRKRGGMGAEWQTPEQARLRLRELVELCDASELAEVAGPMVCSVLSMWELLLLRVDSANHQSRIAALCDEVKSLFGQIKELASTLFQPLDNIVKNSHNITFEIQDETLSSAFGVPCGVYRVDESLLKTDRVPFKNEIQKEDQEGTEPSPQPQNPQPESSMEIEEPINSTSPENEPVPGIGGQFLLSGEEMICDDRSGLDSVDQIVSEQLRNLTGSQNQDLCKSAVDELIKGFALDRTSSVRSGSRPDLEPPDDLMDGFSITGHQRPAHVSASTEDLIKSLENFGSELPAEDRQGFSQSDNFPRVALDFEVLSEDFHSNSVNQQ